MRHAQRIGFAILSWVAVTTACGGTAKEVLSEQNGFAGAAGVSSGGGSAGTGGGTGGSAASAGGSAGATGGSSGGGTGGASGGTGGASGSAGASGASGACGACDALETCFNGNLCVTTLVNVPEAFAIDSTEVTRGQYEDWLATNPSTGGQAPECSWNTDLQPDATCMSDPSVCSSPDCGRHPQVCVDMCDAEAYCLAVGKQLCGRMGGGTVTDLYDATQSEWHNACTSGGVNDFVYGNSADAGQCNDYLSGGDTTVPVASLAGCQSPITGYAGVYDLIGNVEEWEDNCASKDGNQDVCHPRGFPFGMGAAMPMCGQSTYGRRGETAAFRGFRCCTAGGW